ncbi:TetR/AcrR family transcriptional regulator [Halobacillus sp. B23F22_1]|uniref:TetR/AcrR family transcriptional regulator n=1 Tax=Halobacillus sp. B23F22_1 TaxID=3459514 RepID=UPI00373F0AF5
MKNKSLLIIENALRLFAKKGYSNTTVQEIANECNISKGAFYLHFKSKDSLLLEALKHYSRKIQLKSNEIQAMDLDPRTKFIRQLMVTYREIINHRDFIITQIREQALPYNKDIEDFMQHLRFNSYLFYRRNLLAIYGKAIDQTIWEVTLLMQGMFKTYLDLIIIEGMELDIEQLCESILRRADYIVEGFNRTGDQPVINDDIMNRVMPENYYYNQLHTIIETLSVMETSSNEDIDVTISFLLEEIQQEQPRRAVIKGMLSNLEEKDRFKGVSGQIRTFFQL